MNQRIDWQWPAALVFSVAFATLGALVWRQILHPEVLLAMLTWLAPGPWKAKSEASALNSHAPHEAS